jgi:hypothetical protein
MKKLIIIILLITSNTSFSQQFLWTTNSNGLFPNSNIKVISKEIVLDKILEYYEAYKFYYDLTGFTKVGFFEKYGETYSENDDWQKFKKSVLETKEFTISCIKSNSGTGSLITVFMANKDNFDVINFSNEVGIGSLSTTNGRVESEKQRFVKFCRLLMSN